MTERRRIIEGTWSCGECGATDILGRHKQCPQCGAAREQKETAFDFGATAADGASTAATVQEPDVATLAKAGADWHCRYCAAGNRGDADRCHTCGASREELGATAKVAPPEPAKQGGGALRWIAAVVLVLIAVGWWATRKHEEHATVTDLAWEHTLLHERFEQVDREGWRADLRPTTPRPPVDGAGEEPGIFDIRGCRRMEREPRTCRTENRQVPCGTERKCQVKDLGNGFAEEVCTDVPKTCAEPHEVCTGPVVDDRCTYSTHEWRKLGAEHTSGSGDPPRWADPPTTLGPHDRLTREAAYRVSVAYGEGKTHEHHPETTEDFARFKIGDRAEVVVSNLGVVSDVRPASP
jgi:hypothetical protein